MYMYNIYMYMYVTPFKQSRSTSNGKKMTTSPNLVFTPGGWMAVGENHPKLALPVGITQAHPHTHTNHSIFFPGNAIIKHTR